MKPRLSVVVAVLLAMLGSAVPCIAAAQSSTSPPHVVATQLGALKQIDRFSSLPDAIHEGRFTVDGTPAAGWKIAEPGGAFSATDVPVEGAPGRRLIFAACNADLCLIHYERGGIAHFYEILALALTPKGWTAVWNVRGSKPIANLDALRAQLQRGSLGPGWSGQWVKGDF